MEDGERLSLEKMRAWVEASGEVSFKAWGRDELYGAVRARRCGSRIMGGLKRLRVESPSERELKYAYEYLMQVVLRNNTDLVPSPRLLTILMWLLQSVAVAQQATVQVPGTAQILLAGSSQFSTVSGSDSSGRFTLDTFDKNYPVLVNLRLLPGQAIQFAASGQVDVDPNLPSSFRFASPNGTTQGVKIEGGYTGRISGKQGSLVGVFIGDRFFSQYGHSTFLSAADRIDVLDPPLAIPFLIGDGTTPDGVRRTFIVPRLAAKLYLGILDKPANDNGGSFTATLSIVPQPPAPGLINP
ncbi:MAG TPA: hypothetical protein VMZ52_05725, partial [Bryobacteraceae bacterium]|nr:hypothetical protein [Bryobacteraceae bacterium]